MDPKKEIPFAESILKAKVAQICDTLGFHAITQDSSNILVDIYRRTIYHLARHCKESANNNGRTEPTVVDLKQAYDFVGISITELKEHIESVKLPFPYEIPQDDEQKPPNRVQRNLHIDDLLEAEKNNQLEDQEDSENKALSESGRDEDERPPVPLLKDTFAEIANQFQNVTPIAADKKIRLGGRIVLLPGTKLKISTPMPPEPEQSTSASEVSKPPKEKKKKKIEKVKATVKTEPAPSITPTPSPIKQSTGKKKKKISREFIIENSPDGHQSDHKEKPRPEKVSTSKKNTSKKKIRTPSPIVAPPEPPIPEPPPPPTPDVKPAVRPPDLVVSSPKPPKENKAKRKKREFDEILLPPEEPTPVEPKEIQKLKASRKKIKTEAPVNITPLDPSAAEPPSFFPILDIKTEAPIEDDDEIIPQPSVSISTTPTLKQPKGKKKKKKSAENQFAIVTETVTQVEEKEWFCPACGGPDDGDLMVQCDSCQEWYHLGCTDLKKPPEENENWECDACFNKARAQPKRPSSSMEVVKIEPPEPVAPSPPPPPPPPPSQSAPPPVPMPGTSQDDLCPECNLPDNGTLMIQCDDPFCAKWFHGKCVSLLDAPKEDESWFCKVCVEKQQSAFKRRRRAK